MLNVANQIAAWGRPVDLVLLRAQGSYLNLVDARIHIVDLGAKNPITSLLYLKRYLKKKLPCVLLASMDAFNVLALVASRLAHHSPPVVINCQVNMSSQAWHSGRLRDRLMPLVCRFFYQKAGAITAASSGVAEDLAIRTRVPRSRITVIYNSVAKETFEGPCVLPTHASLIAQQPPIILAVGRLVPQKDFSTLLHAFSALLRSRDARLIVLGEGPERQKLEQLARRLKIERAIDMPGFVDNPAAYMKRCKLFVLSSAWEGFGLVLAEALACGCSIVSTDCPSGPREILRDGDYGRLVPVGDVEALTAAMALALDTDHDPANSKERASEFSPEKAARSFLTLIDGCTAQSPKSDWDIEGAH
jgi:glycosyltransferase involved in cell wall biosynthesis